MAQSPPSGQAPSVASEDSGQRVLDVLKVLIQTGKAKSTKDLIRYATQANAFDVLERLKVLDEEGVPLDLAFDAVSVHIRLLTHKRNSGLLRSCHGKRVALVLPLPPPVVEIFKPVAEMELLQPGEGHLPGFYHQFESKIIHGSRACRSAATKVDVVVFQSVREAEKLWGDPSVADVVENPQLPETTTLIVHLRPHRDPEDIELSVPLAKVKVL
ncbi:MAG TPA: hypothetical protein VGP99_02170 [Tepidisphaeraceae bacterium]|jgi:hypothetical protein|nr:hypothetical protein [Tepidisphaeraceae bacterium]